MLGINNLENQILTIAIVDMDLGSKILIEAKKIGITGGTILLGRGTIRNPLLNLLGIDEARKEIVLMITPNNLEEKIHNVLSDKFQMHKPNHGIVLSLMVGKVFGLHSMNKQSSITGGITMNYEVIFTIVEKGLAQDVVDAAKLGGSTGATIINARGSGIHEHTKFFSMDIEPEKEIVMIIIQKDKVEDVIKSIEATMHIDEPGKGILFTLDVNRVTGLYNQNNN